MKGTRVPVRTLLASLAEGGTQEEILADFPTMSMDALRAVIAFAAASAGDDLPDTLVPELLAHDPHEGQGPGGKPAQGK